MSRAPKSAPPSPSRLSLLALEPRWVFDGAGVVTEPDLWPSDVQDRAAAPTPDPERPAEPAALPASLTRLGSARSELVVVDGSLADLQTLLNDIRQASPERSVLVLDQGGKELEQLSTHLQQHPQAYDAIHWLSHGGEGWIRLGSQVLTLGDAGAQAALWSSVRESLTANGDLLLYGCNIASGPEGRTGVEKLAQITGADVAASTDVTGGTAGDWVLEQQVGAVEAQSLEPAIWQGVLAAPTVSNPIVNEGSPYVVFEVPQVSPDPSVLTLLELVALTASDRGTDVGFARESPLSNNLLQYSTNNGATWVKYVAGNTYGIGPNETLHVRTPIFNDGISDNNETVRLRVGLLLSSYNNYNTQLVITGDATIKDDGTGQWFSGASGTGSNSAPAGSVLDNDSVSLTVTSPTVSESAGFAQWAVQYGTGKKVFLELADLTATAAADLLPFSNGNFLQYNNGSGWTDYSTGSQVAVGAGNSLLVRAGIRGSDGPEASEQLNLRVRPAVGNQYDISGTNVVDVDIATNAARADAAQTLITNGNFSAGTILERWGLIPGWTSSGGGTSTYAKVVNFNRDSATNNSMEGLYFGNSVVVNGIMPILDANGVTTAGTPFQPATTMGRGAGCGR